jgi:hypothetical protein
MPHTLRPTPDTNTLAYLGKRALSKSEREPQLIELAPFTEAKLERIA